MNSFKKGDLVIYRRGKEFVRGIYAGDGLNDTLALVTFEDGQTFVVSSQLLTHDHKRRQD